MSMIDLHLPATLRDHMASRVAHDDFAGEGDYLRCLVARDLDRVERLRSATQEGIDSGISPLSFEQIVAQAHRRNSAGG